jgi:hypothetical protein
LEAVSVAVHDADALGLEFLQRLLQDALADGGDVGAAPDVELAATDIDGHHDAVRAGVARRLEAGIRHVEDAQGVLVMAALLAGRARILDLLDGV